MSKRTYGIWIPGQGWLAAATPKGSVEPVAFDSWWVTFCVSLRVGHHASVQYIDKSLAALEQKLLGVEKERKSRRLFRRRSK